MTTQTLTQQVHLVSIISIAEDRLQTNFKTILNRLRSHDQQILSQNQEMKKVTLGLSERIDNNLQKNQSAINILSQQIEKCFQMISELSTQNKEQDLLIKQCQSQIQKNRNEMSTAISVCEDKINQTLSQVADSQERLKKVEVDVYKAYEQILKKQDSTQVLKISRQVEGTKEKIDKNQKQCKLLEHKIEKMQIYNQKVERNQSKKQIQLMRQIEQRIKKELKIIQKNSQGDLSARYSNQSVSASGIENDQNQSPEARSNIASTPRQALSSRKQSHLRLSKLRNSHEVEDDDSALINIKNSFQKIALAKLNEKLDGLQCKIKNLESSFNGAMNSQRKIAKPDNEQIKEKINEIKPELIKIWAKCDTLDDRIAFNQRKMEQKTKMLNSLLDCQKQNNVGKIDEKLKAFQTQVYTIVKELKAKLDGKVNTQDYEKYCIALEQKMRQLSQIVFLKSDKLEVKKALLFLESKIKQIILVISEDQQNEKDALLTKKQLKCMSCDKDIDKISKLASTSSRGNWDSMPYKQHSPELLGKFGMTGYGSLSKKLKKLQSKQLPVLRSKKNNNNNTLQPIVNTIPEADTQSETK